MMKKRLRPIFIIVLMTALFLLLAEVGARVLLWRSPLTPQLAEAATYAFTIQPHGRGDLLPNLRHIERTGIIPYYLQTNSDGLRNSKEIIEDTAVKRILAVGDSFTFGFYVDNYATFPARLEETLNQHGPHRVQVLNAGVIGYTIVDELAYLRDKGWALQPDVLVLGVYTNDIFDLSEQIRPYYARDARLAARQTDATTPPLRAVLRDHIALYSLWYRLRNGDFFAESIQIQDIPTISGLHQVYQDATFLKPNDPAYAPLWSAYTAHFRQLAQTAQEANIPLVVVLFPDLAQLPTTGGLPDVPQRFFAQLTAETGATYVDLLPIFRQIGDISSLYLMYYDPSAPINPDAPDAAVMAYVGDGHLSSYGNIVAARAVADVLLTSILD